MSLLFAQICHMYLSQLDMLLQIGYKMHVFDSAMQNPIDFLFPRAICNFNDNHI